MKVKSLMKTEKNKVVFSFVILFTTLVFATSCKKDDEVVKIETEISWATPADIYVGTELSATQLNATANCEGIFVYTPKLGAKLILGAEHVLKVEFTPIDTLIYNKAIKTVKINLVDFPGTASDADANVYQTIIIGTQTWMAENLSTTKYNDGTPIPFLGNESLWLNANSDGAGGYCWYNNDLANKPIYGALYKKSNININKLCPAGWHVPTTINWNTLISYLGGSNIAGGKLKAIGGNSWSIPNIGATNESGFSSRGGGLRWSNGGYEKMGTNCNWWAYETSWCLGMDYNSKEAVLFTSDPNHGFYVRCIKD